MPMLEIVAQMYEFGVANTTVANVIPDLNSKNKGTKTQQVS